LAGSFGKLFNRWRAEPSTDWLLQAWEAAATPRGTQIRVHDGSGRELRGTFAGIEADGALRLQLSNGETEIVRAGDVEL
jgi:BirA family biotin operon repressor/biotin-[acetyl-CoA-carboxylase] ligase